MNTLELSPSKANSSLVNLPIILIADSCVNDESLLSNIGLSQPDVLEKPSH
jgi:hypothetical protein